jgi:hypothetical protein
MGVSGSMGQVLSAIGADIARGRDCASATVKGLACPQQSEWAKESPVAKTRHDLLDRYLPRDAQRGKLREWDGVKISTRCKF